MYIISGKRRPDVATVFCKKANHLIEPVLLALLCVLLHPCPGRAWRRLL